MKSRYAILSPASRRARGGGCALAVMIKAPRAGASKTRLVPPLTHDEAAALSVCFLRDTAENIAAACAASAGAPRGVAVYTPRGAEGEFGDLLPADFALLAQRGEGFGERLFHASSDLLASGFDSVCLIDSDSPTLPTRALVAAAEELSRPGDRLVLGAADDGGYYLVGVKAAHPRLFAEIDWSTARVFAQTLARAQEIALPVVQLPAWYDVDDAATLARLCAELFGLPEAATSCDPIAAPNVEGCDEAGSADISDCAAAGGDAPPSADRHAHVDEHADASALGYPAPHTRDFIARLMAREGRARIWREGAAQLEEKDSNADGRSSSAGAEATR